MKRYIIRNKNNRDMYWSNEWGWIEFTEDDDEFVCSIFSEKEKEKFNLPINGKWELFF